MILILGARQTAFSRSCSTTPRTPHLLIPFHAAPMLSILLHLGRLLVSWYLTPGISFVKGGHDPPDDGNVGLFKNGSIPSTKTIIQTVKKDPPLPFVVLRDGHR